MKSSGWSSWICHFTTAIRTRSSLKSSRVQKVSESPSPLEALKQLAAKFPLEPGVYLMKNAREKVVYVGKAKSLRSRVRSYFGNSSDMSLKTKYLMQQVAAVEYILTKTEVEALLLEASLIKK